MRRRRMSQFCFRIRLNGVIVNATHRPVSVQVPVECVMYSMGLAPNSLWKPSQTRCASGTRHTRKIGGLSHRMSMCRERSFMFELKPEALLVIFPQVQPVIHAGDLIAVAIEHQRLDSFAEERSIEAPFARLAPAGMIYLRIDVGVEAILVRVRDVPRSRGHILREANLHNRFDALEAVFPGNHGAHG